MGTAASSVRQSAQTITPDYYLWAFPGSPVQVRIKLETIGALRRSLAAATGNGVETAGLLLGAVDANRIEIADFVQLESGSATPAGALKTADVEGLREKAQHSRPSGKELAPVGYFHGVSRGPIRLSQDDLSVIHECFRDPSNVFLIMSQGEHGNATAGFFFWDSGSIFGDATFMQFALDEAVLAARPVPVVPLAVPLNTSVNTGQASELKSDAKASSKPTNRLYWLVSALGLTATVAAAVLYFFWSREPQTQNANATTTAPAASPAGAVFPSPVSPMSLSAARSNKDIVISWNANLLPISSARVGVLTIKDRNSQTEVPLTRDQLQISKLIYTSKSDQLAITLEVFSASGQSTREAIMIAGPQEQGAERFRAGGLESRVRPQNSGSASPKVNGSQPVTGISTQKENLPAPTVDSLPAPVRTFTVNPPAKATDTSERSVIADAAPKLQVNALDASRIQAPGPLMPSQAQMELPKPKPAENPPAQNLPLQLPVPIRQVKPALPPNLTKFLNKRVDVRVRVSVDEKGKVVRAEAIQPATGVGEYLNSIALGAAREWTFQPARRGGVALDSEMVLTFTFVPGK